jgi:hypothetical protein
MAVPPPFLRFIDVAADPLDLVAPKQQVASLAIEHEGEVKRQDRSMPVRLPVWRTR